MNTPNANKAANIALANFFQSKLPIQTIATFTFPHSVDLSRPAVCDKARFHLQSCARTIQREQRIQVGYIVAFEKAKGIPLHMHVALVAPRPVLTSIVREAWYQEIGYRHTTSVEADRYIPDGGFLSYMLKADNEDCCGVEFSHNLTRFNRDTWQASKPLNCRERRARWHIAQQSASSRYSIGSAGRI